MKVKEELKIAIKALRDQGVEGQLYAAPACTSVRCFVPCNPGSCICRATVDNKFCVVDAKGLKHAREWANREVKLLGEFITEIEAFPK